MFATLHATQLLAALQRTDARCWLAVDGDRLMGIITRNDPLHFSVAKLERARQTM
jgi:hypothetical protein